MENIEYENKVMLDLKIIKKKHELEKIKLNSRYKLLKEYNKILEDLKQLLKKQKDIDKVNFFKNLMNVKEFKDEVLKRKKNKALFKKLNKYEKDFILEKEYDYLNDKLKLLTNYTSPNCDLVYEWNKLREEIFNKGYNNSN